MANDIKGLKRICGACSARFYDMNKRPIICPSCGIEFTGELRTKAKRGRMAAIEEQEAANAAKGQVEESNAVDEDDDEDEDEDEDDGVEIVSLDDDTVTTETSDDSDAKKPDLDSIDDEDDVVDLGDVTSLDDEETPEDDA